MNEAVGIGCDSDWVTGRLQFVVFEGYEDFLIDSQNNCK